MTSALTALQVVSYAAYKLYEGALQPWNALARLGKKLLQLFHAYAYKAPQPKAPVEQYVHLEPRKPNLPDSVIDVEAFNAEAQQLADEQYAALGLANPVHPPEPEDGEETT